MNERQRKIIGLAISCLMASLPNDDEHYDEEGHIAPNLQELHELQKLVYEQTPEVIAAKIADRLLLITGGKPQQATRLVPEWTNEKGEDEEAGSWIRSDIIQEIIPILR